MSIINPQKKLINCKIAYYGPALSGKTTSMRYLQHQLSKLGQKKLEHTVPETERTLFFDFMAMTSKEKIKGYQVRFQVYTVPGQVLYEDSRRLLLNGVDGIIFVVDSRLEYVQDSIRALRELELNLERLGYKPNDIPLVIQYNKRDCPTAAPVAELSKIINTRGVPEFQTTAKKGVGIKDAFDTILKHVIQDLKRVR